MEPDYNKILLPIISAVMLSQNRPLSLDEISDGVIALLNSQRDKQATPPPKGKDNTSNANNSKNKVAQKKKKYQKWG